MFPKVKSTFLVRKKTYFHYMPFRQKLLLMLINVSWKKKLYLKRAFSNAMNGSSKHELTKIAVEYVKTNKDTK
jgi:hypothetical protein